MFINKFIEPTDMTSEQFFSRWKQLSQYDFFGLFKSKKFFRPSQECQKIFPATQPMDTEIVSTKV